jgi:hypothetical protein
MLVGANISLTHCTATLSALPHMYHFISSDYTCVLYKVHGIICIPSCLCVTDYRRDAMNMRSLQQTQRDHHNSSSISELLIVTSSKLA